MRIWVPFLFVFAACGGDAPAPSSAPDAGVDVADDAPDPPADTPRLTPEGECPSARWSTHGICLPEAPRFQDWDCPEGWEARPGIDDAQGGDATPAEIAAFTVCAPPEVPRDCPTGQMASVASAECQQHGEACPEERFPSEEAIRARAPAHEGLVVYVAPGGNGSGSREAPFGTLAQAIAAAEEGGVIALSKGRHRATVQLPGGLAVVGACVAETVVEAEQTGDNAATFVLRGRDARLTNLTITGAARGVEIEGRVEMAAIRVESAQLLGIHVNPGAALTGTALVVTDTQPSSAGTHGYGLLVEGGSVLMTGVVLSANHTGGITVEDGASVNLRDFLLEDTQPQRSDQTEGRGLVVTDAKFSASRAVVRGNAEAAGIAFGRTSEMNFTDALISDTKPSAADGSFGFGLVLLDSAAGTLERVQLLRNRNVAVAALDAGAIWRLTDVTIRDTEPESVLMDGGRGIDVGDGARVHATRVVLQRNHAVGIHVEGALATSTFDDIVVLDTLARVSDGSLGRAIDIGFQGQAVLNRVHVERAREVGFLLYQSGLVEVGDLLVADTQPQENDLTGGQGMQVNESHIELRRAWLRGNYHVGLLALEHEAVLDLRDIIVHDQRRSICGAACEGYEGGMAMALLESDSTLRRFEIDGSEFVGLQVGYTRKFSARDGFITGCGIGLNVQRFPLDVDEVFVDVQVFDNDTNFDTSEIAVPTADELVEPD